LFASPGLGADHAWVSLDNWHPADGTWTLLHAQSLLNGPGSGAHAIAFSEDDYRRLRTRVRS
jgi:hypothetical protein